MHTVWILDELILIDFSHAGHFWVLPFRWVFLVEESPLLVTKGLLHLLMLFVKSGKVAGKRSDTFAQARVLLEEFGLRFIDVV